MSPRISTIFYFEGNVATIRSGVFYSYGEDVAKEVHECDAEGCTVVANSIPVGLVHTHPNVGDMASADRKTAHTNNMGHYFDVYVVLPNRQVKVHYHEDDCNIPEGSPVSAYDNLKDEIVIEGMAFREYDSNEMSEGEENYKKKWEDSSGACKARYEAKGKKCEFCENGTWPGAQIL